MLHGPNGHRHDLSKLKFLPVLNALGTVLFFGLQMKESTNHKTRA